MKTLFTLVAALGFAAAAIAGGTITGKVLDANNAEALIGATVVLEGTTQGVATDIDGNFTLLDLPAGSYNLVVSYIGYQQKTERQVAVVNGQTTTVSLALKPTQNELKEIVVRKEIVRHDNASAMVIMQRNATVIQSGVSQEEIRKSPDRNSGDVIKRMSGAVVSEGKYAVIRGLADRYNMAMVNGMILPSTEPDRKTFAFDLFPSNMLDNMIVYKTAQPDLPSEFAGGIINMNTRDIPEKSFVQLTYSNLFIQGSTFQKYQTNTGGKYDALGFDDGSRQLPANFPSVDSMSAWNNYNPKKYQAAKQLLNRWGSKPGKGIAYPGQSVQFSGGFSKKLKRAEWGGVVAVNYKNELRQQAIAHRQSIAGSDTDWVYNETRYINATQLGAMANLALQIDGRLKLALKTFFNQQGENITTQRHEKDYNTGDLFDREIYQFTATQLLAFQLSGDHFMPKSGVKLHWAGGMTQLHRNQPMTRGISYRYYNNDYDDADTLTRQLAISNSVNPLMGGLFFANLKERQYTAAADAAVPFHIKSEKQWFKTGVYFLQKERDYQSRILGFIKGPQYKPAHNSDNYETAFDTANLNKQGYVLAETTNKKESYGARSRTVAAFAMLDNKFSIFHLVWGLRFEHFRQELNSFDQTNQPANRNNTYLNFLPSANAIISVREDMNVRLSYSMTTSRPEFRELVDNAYYDFTTNYSITGNPNLTQTQIHNADVRYEWFLGRGQMVSASAFYKRILHPIELLAQAGTGSVQAFQFNNNSKAHLAGVEVEVKKNFDFMNRAINWKQWENFSLSFNVAYIWSRIAVTDSSVAGNKNRALYGQAPYVVNVALQYNEPVHHFSCGLLFNISGPKIFAVSGLNQYDIYENARPQLDFQISKGFFKNHFQARFVAGDLIARPTIRYYNAPNENKNFDGRRDQVFGIWNNYRTFQLALTYSF
ncbi:MAG: carboxypeptidase-like regulatory domain-containing protein [Chitinophagales bacterium]